MLLCSVHVLRYFKEKVFTGRAYWGDAGEKNYLGGEEKDELMKQIVLVRDSPSQEEYSIREEKLLSMSKDLSIRPGQVTKPVSFLAYYHKNWKSCAFRWIFAYRKNLPTLGTNDTQASESTFRAIKHYSSVEFGNRVPSLTELVKVLPKILDRRSAERENTSTHRRLVLHDPENEDVDKALESASWKLNEGGYRLFYQEMKAALFKKENMKLEGNVITEKYIGNKTRTYVGHYETDGIVCNCSWYQSRLLCRHPFFYRMMKNIPLFDISMFHPSFRSKHDVNDISAVEVGNGSIDLFEMSENVNTRLGSPGMEYLLEEEQNANKKLKKNVKFNKAFDVAKVAAEYISMYSTEQFYKNLETFKQFTELLRTGLPNDVVNVLKKHSEPNNDPIEKEVEDIVEPTIALKKTPTLLSTQSKVKEICEGHRQLIPDNYGVYPVPGDGSCFFGSLAAHIYQDETQASNLRRLCHYYLVDNWWYFQAFVALPFTETIGVGAASYRVCIDTDEELQSFYLSDESLKCYSNSQVDFAVVASLFNMNIGVFTYGLDDLPPRWSWTSPDPLLTEYSTTTKPCLDSIPDALLYHSDNVHYELLVSKTSTLATQGNVTSRLAAILNGPEETYADEIVELTLEERVGEPIPVDHLANQPASFMSPLIFKHCPKGPGRPKKKREGAPVAKKPSKRMRPNDDTELNPIEIEDQPPPKKRGRPKGSKNKPTKKDTIKARDRAEKAADPDQDETFHDSGDICDICEFPFNHPLKRTKPKMKCKRCSKTVHIPCYLKSGCTCTW